MKHLVALTTLCLLFSCKLQTLYLGTYETRYRITDSSMTTLSSENRRIRFERKGNTIIVTHVGTSNSLGSIDLHRIRKTWVDSSGMFTRYLTRDSSWILIWPSSHATVQSKVIGNISYLEYYDAELKYSRPLTPRSPSVYRGSMAFRTFYVPLKNRQFLERDRFYNVSIRII